MLTTNHYYSSEIPVKPKNRFKRFMRFTLLLIIVFLILFVLFTFLKDRATHKYNDSPNIKLGATGLCLDDYKDKLGSSELVDAWGCNSSEAQIWNLEGTNIVHDSSYCLGVVNDSQSKGAKVAMSPCAETDGQVWLRDQGGYQNPNSTLCLSASPSNPSSSLFITTCNNLYDSSETWSPVANSSSNQILTTSCTGNNEGQLVACYAEKEWTTWNDKQISHEQLLNTYTDGAPYEEWCADFVSYVYKEAGFPFTNGSADGWDENNANDIQYMGFTMHMANSGYVPRIGDVGYFNYNGGHVEIVIVGGAHPSFIYGDSATIDPTTGNGQMKANTITGNEYGQIVYYLTPS